MAFLPLAKLEHSLQPSVPRRHVHVAQDMIVAGFAQQRQRLQEDGERDTAAEHPVVKARLRPARAEAVSKLTLERRVDKFACASMQSRWCDRFAAARCSGS